MAVEQIDMFAALAGPPQPRQSSAAPVLNGFYYEASSRKFVCYALGRRHFETDGFKYPADWKARLKKERQI